MATRPRAITRLHERPRHYGIIVYSEPGGGKTRLAGTSPNALILNADGSDAVESARVAGSTAHVWDINTYKDLDDAYEYMRRGTHSYEWVWLDSISLFQEKGMDDIMAEVVKSKPHRDPFVPDRLEYVKNMNHLSKWVRHMKALPINFGITAHVLRVEDEDDGEVTYMPWVQGRNMPSKVCGYMSIVGRLYVAKKKGGDEQVRVLQVRKDGKWYAKDRFDALGEKVIDPTIPMITSKVLAAGGSRKTTTRRKRPTARRSA